MKQARKIQVEVSLQVTEHLYQVEETIIRSTLHKPPMKQETFFNLLKQTLLDCDFLGLVQISELVKDDCNREGEFPRVLAIVMSLQKLSTTYILSPNQALIK